MLMELYLVHHSPIYGKFYYFYVFVAIVVIGENATKTLKDVEYRQSD